MACTISSTIQRHNADNMNDMISNLPDGVLLYILSFLTTKDAVRTSILSSKWKYLWTQLPVFEFETPYPLYALYEKNKKLANCLLDLVDKLLYKSHCVERLYIEVQGIAVDDAGKVSSLLSSALKCKVLDLKLTIEFVNSSFVLPYSLSASQSLNKLYLDFGFLLYVPDGIHFPSLKTLYLSRLSFANEMSVQRLFSGCPVLQELTLNKCCWVHIKNISVAISTLRKLTIDFIPSSLNYAHCHRCRVKIDAVNLLSLSYSSTPDTKMFLVNPTSLIDAYIDLMSFSPRKQLFASRFAIELLGKLGSVKSLILSKNTIQCLRYEKDIVHLLPSLHHLTHLDVHLKDSYLLSSDVLVKFLHKTPKLEVLRILAGFDVFFDREGWTSDLLPWCFKSSLKLCSISDFHGYKGDIRLVKFLLENVTVLEEINILCSGYLSANLQKLDDVRDQLQPLCLGSCVIKFH